MGGVLRFGEKRAFRRIIGRSADWGVQSSNWKWLRLLGPIADKFAWRTHGLGQAGGGRGTGLEPSPCNPAQWKATQRTASITALPRLAQWQPKPARGGHLALPNNQNTATVKSGLTRSYLMAPSAFVARPEGAPRSGETRCRRMAGRNAGANIGRATSLVARFIQIAG
jgi:hypothetical protein